MPSQPPRLCGRCRQPVSVQVRCPTCYPAVQADGDRRRGTAAQRGYGARHVTRFRAAVLRRDPLCVLCQLRIATVADHWPLDRRALVAAGLDPDDPEHGRGLCAPCHGRETARLQPGGWNA